MTEIVEKSDAAVAEFVQAYVEPDAQSAIAKACALVDERIAALRIKLDGIAAANDAVRARDGAHRQSCADYANNTASKLKQYDRLINGIGEMVLATPAPPEHANGGAAT